MRIDLRDRSASIGPGELFVVPRGVEFSNSRARDVLLRLTGQEARIKQQHFDIWNAVATWKVESRHNVTGTAGRAEATAMIQAAEQLLTGL